MAVKGGFVGRVVENLQELTSAEVEHELRVEGKVLLQRKRGWVVLSIVGKSRTQADKHPVHPSQDVRAIVNLRLKDGYSRHENRRRLLVKRLRNGRVSGGSAQVPKYRGDSQVKLTRRMLVVRQELNHAFLWGLWVGSGPLTGDLEIDTVAGPGINAAHLPGACVPNAAFRLSNRNRLFVEGDGMPNEARHFQLLGCQHFKGGIKAHEKVVIAVFLKDANERLFEHRGREAIRQNHMAARRVAKTLHFQEADLVQAASEYVDDVAVMSRAFSQVIVKLKTSIQHAYLWSQFVSYNAYLESLFVVLDVVSVNVVMRSNRLTEFRPNDHAWSFRGWTTSE